ncbi:MAG: RNA-binding protein [Lentisphaeria bacterium]|nr:RNA-binding protein [Lentisphaeria bacterium]
MNIYVGNLPYNTSDQDLSDLFASYGEVKSAKVIMDRETGRSRGFGFVEVIGNGQEAVDALNGSDFEGRNLVVNEAREKPNNRRPSGGGGGNRNFNRDRRF